MSGALVPVKPQQFPISSVKDLGSIFSASGLFQDAHDASKAVVKILAGRELGFGPIASMVGVYLVKGKVSLSANLMAAAVRKSERYDYVVTEHPDTLCTIEFTYKDKKVGTSSFSISDAKNAKLDGGDNWKKFPRNMLFARAMSNGCRWYCPDLFSGSTPYTPEELDPRIELTEDGDVKSAPPGACEAAVVIDAEVVEPATLSITRARMDALIRETQTDPGAIVGYFEVPSLDDMTESEMFAAIDVLEKKKSL